MSTIPIERVINSALRYGQALFTALKSLTPNKRFLNLNIFIGTFIVIILFQSFIISRIGFKSSDSGLLLLKSEVYSSNYDTLLKHHKPEDIKKRSLEERCNLYFDSLTMTNKDWKLADFDTEGHDDNSYNFEEYLVYYKSKNPDEVIDEKKNDELEATYREKYQMSSKVANKIIDYISTVRIFSKCFLDNDATSKFSTSGLKNYWGSDEEEQDVCYDTEARIFPWLSNILPVYTRWDGTVSVGIPNLSKSVIDNLDTDSSFKNDNVDKRSKRETCFLKAFRSTINGKGYVISASDGQVNELKRLALVLRALGNTLPIQIVHKGDLSVKNQEVLIDAFRSNINTNNLQELYEELNVDKYVAGKLNFPKQEVWFVDVQHSVKSEYLQHFKKYANKLLAYLFNSFEEMILIDTDTVPFVKLDETIHNFPDYVSKGAYFFYDRQLANKNFENSVNYYKRLFPSKLDTYFFNIPQVTDFTLKNRFIGDHRNHFMESGVVAINRRCHFTGMLITIQLNFYDGINSSKIHGDKELFWLGLSSAGDEDYAFNALGAASIGELTPQENKRLPNSIARELCSNHPGHIDGHDKSTLMWINSGMTYCKNVNFAGSDAGKPLYKGRYDGDQLKKLYESEMKIRAAIIPPPQEIDGSNNIDNPAVGWTDEHKYCGAYTWCAYDFIGNGELDELKGTYIEFNSFDYTWFDLIGNIWMNGLPKVAYDKKDIPTKSINDDLMFDDLDEQK